MTGVQTCALPILFVLWLKFPPDDMKLLTAIVVAIFLAVPNLRAAKRNSFSRIAKQNAKAAKTIGEG